jgi:4-hydroxy-tetrahydrodipicolinate reductase
MLKFKLSICGLFPFLTKERDMIKVLIAGLPGNMATVFARYALKDDKIDVVRQSITGADVKDTECDIDGHVFKLIKANNANRINELLEENRSAIVVDYTEPGVAENNIQLYCAKMINFVMGTTGVDVNRISKTIKESDINAVIAPNMGKQIVALQAMLKYASDNFPACFDGYKLTVKESHQNGKADTSGTARAMVEYFNTLGMKFQEDEIVKYREPNDQIALGIPEEYLKGHGWHTYAFTSPDGSVHFEITHNVNGRDIYAKGTIDSIYYLDDKIKNGMKGTIYTMIDVLKNR